MITHHGRGRAVILSAERFEELISTAGLPAADRSVNDYAQSLSQLMEHVADGFVAFRADMTVTAINGAACSFLKIQRDAILHRRFDEVIPGIEESLGYANLTRAARSGSTSTFEAPSYAFEGRWLLFQTFPFEEGAACLFRDITDEQEARMNAEARTAALAAMAAHGGMGRARLSMRGTFTEIDEIFAGFAGFTPEGLGRARLTDILVPRCRSAATDAIELVLEGGSARAIEVELLTRSGAERAVRIGLAPLRGQGAGTGAVTVMTDRRPGAPPVS